MSTEETARLWKQTRARATNIELLCQDILTTAPDPERTDWLAVLDRLARISHEAETMGHLILDYARQHGLTD